MTGVGLPPVTPPRVTASPRRVGSTTPSPTNIKYEDSDRSSVGSREWSVPSSRSGRSTSMSPDSQPQSPQSDEDTGAATEMAGLPSAQVNPTSLSAPAGMPSHVLAGDSQVVVAASTPTWEGGPDSDISLEDEEDEPQQASVPVSRAYLQQRFSVVCDVLLCDKSRCGQLVRKYRQPHFRNVAAEAVSTWEQAASLIERRERRITQLMELESASSTLPPKTIHAVRGACLCGCVSCASCATRTLPRLGSQGSVAIRLWAEDRRRDALAAIAVHDNDISVLCKRLLDKFGDQLLYEGTPYPAKMVDDLSLVVSYLDAQLDDRVEAKHGVGLKVPHATPAVMMLAPHAGGPAMRAAVAAPTHTQATAGMEQPRQVESAQGQRSSSPFSGSSRSSSSQSRSRSPPRSRPSSRPQQHGTRRPRSSSVSRSRPRSPSPRTAAPQSPPPSESSQSRSPSPDSARPASRVTQVSRSPRAGSPVNDVAPVDAGHHLFRLDDTPHTAGDSGTQGRGGRRKTVARRHQQKQGQLPPTFHRHAPAQVALGLTPQRPTSARAPRTVSRATAQGPGERAGSSRARPQSAASVVTTRPRDARWLAQDTARRVYHHPHRGNKQESPVRRRPQSARATPSAASRRGRTLRGAMPGREALAMGAQVNAPGRSTHTRRPSSAAPSRVRGRPRSARLTRRRPASAAQSHGGSVSATNPGTSARGSVVGGPTGGIAPRSEHGIALSAGGAWRKARQRGKAARSGALIASQIRARASQELGTCLEYDCGFAGPAFGKPAARSVDRRATPRQQRHVPSDADSTENPPPTLMMSGLLLWEARPGRAREELALEVLQRQEEARAHNHGVFNAIFDQEDQVLARQAAQAANRGSVVGGVGGVGGTTVAEGLVWWQRIEQERAHRVAGAAAAQAREEQERREAFEHAQRQSLEAAYQRKLDDERYWKLKKRESAAIRMRLQQASRLRREAEQRQAAAGDTLVQHNAEAAPTQKPAPEDGVQPQEGTAADPEADSHDGSSEPQPLPHTSLTSSEPQEPRPLDQRTAHSPPSTASDASPPVQPQDAAAEAPPPKGIPRFDRVRRPSVEYNADETWRLGYGQTMLVPSARREAGEVPLMPMLQFGDEPVNDQSQAPSKPGPPTADISLDASQGLYVGPAGVMMVTAPQTELVFPTAKAAPPKFRGRSAAPRRKPGGGGTPGRSRSHADGRLDGPTARSSGHVAGLEVANGVVTGEVAAVPDDEATHNHVDTEECNLVVSQEGAWSVESRNAHSEAPPDGQLQPPEGLEVASVLSSGAIPLSQRQHESPRRANPKPAAVYKLEGADMDNVPPSAGVCAASGGPKYVSIPFFVPTLATSRRPVRGRKHKAARPALGAARPTPPSLQQQAMQSIKGVVVEEGGSGAGSRDTKDSRASEAGANANIDAGDCDGAEAMAASPQAAAAQPAPAQPVATAGPQATTAVGQRRSKASGKRKATKHPRKRGRATKTVPKGAVQPAASAPSQDDKPTRVVPWSLTPDSAMSPTIVPTTRSTALESDDADPRPMSLTLQSNTD